MCTKRKFLSTLSLRRATPRDCPASSRRRYFYPRSPCGERRGDGKAYVRDSLFLSTLSLRRATCGVCWQRHHRDHFYPRSPCGERPATKNRSPRSENFYPRSPCGERRYPTLFDDLKVPISIHALLAESDPKHFLTRFSTFQFLSTLSLRRATTPRLSRVVPTPIFLSTLSLRRATLAQTVSGAYSLISIHALLAESDLAALAINPITKISIHALLAESDPQGCYTVT